MISVLQRVREARVDVDGQTVGAIGAGLLSCSLTSFTRSIMPLRNCLPKPASGPDRSWMEPRVISVLLTPWLSWACAVGAANAMAQASAESSRVFLNFMPCLLCCDG